MCGPAGSVPSGILQHCVLDDLPALRRRAFHPLRGSWDTDLPGSSVSGAPDWSCIQLIAGEAVRILLPCWLSRGCTHMYKITAGVQAKKVVAVTLLI